MKVTLPTCSVATENHGAERLPRSNADYDQHVSTRIIPARNLQAQKPDLLSISPATREVAVVRYLTSIFQGFVSCVLQLDESSQLQTTALTIHCPTPGSTTYPIFPVTDSGTMTDLSLVDLSIAEPAHAVVPGYDPDKAPPNETCVEPRHRTPQLTAEKESPAQEKHQPERHPVR